MIVNNESNLRTRKNHPLPLKTSLRSTLWLWLRFYTILFYDSCLHNKLLQILTSKSSEWKSFRKFQSSSSSMFSILSFPLPLIPQLVHLRREFPPSLFDNSPEKRFKKSPVVKITFCRNSHASSVGFPVAKSIRCRRSRTNLRPLSKLVRA